MNFGEEITCNQLNQAMASRIKLTFKNSGEYMTHIRAIDEFMVSGEDDLSDVLGTEKMVYPPMDSDRISEVIELADGIRDC